MNSKQQLLSVAKKRTRNINMDWKQSGHNIFFVLNEPEMKHSNDTQNNNQKKPEQYGSWINMRE